MRGSKQPSTRIRTAFFLVFHCLKVSHALHNWTDVPSLLLFMSSLLC